MGEFILAVDQGTSATKAILYDYQNGRLAHRYDAAHRQYYPRPGWVEHDADEIFEKTLEAIRNVMEKNGVGWAQIEVIAVTNQRETAVVWDKTTGRPVYNAIVWQCNRGKDICEELAGKGYGEKIREKSGLVLSPYFSAAKIRWILDNVEGAREKADAGKLLFGTVDSWLIWKLTGGKVHATDYSNASRTQLFNIYDLCWDEELLEMFRTPKCMAPEIMSSNRIFGHTSEIPDKGLAGGIPISGVMGDSHAALFGQNCFNKGMAKATYGTGSSVMMNIGSTPLKSEKGLVTSLAWGIDGQIDYVFEGNINCTGATIKWLVEDLELIDDDKSSGKIAASVEDNNGVYLVPAFVGLSAPYWESEAKAIITGITRGTKKAHIVRAAEESIGYQITDILILMSEESGINLKELRADGGPTRDSFLMQFQADILGVPVVINEIEELSAVGSAYMAGLAVGIWKSKDEILSLRKQCQEYKPKMDQETRDRLYSGWKEAVRRAIIRV